MNRAPVIVDVIDAGIHRAGMDAGVIVVVDPLYGSAAVAASLDAGWASVELAVERDGEPPIPLVSFEQPPVAELRAERCRVRSSDLVDALDALGADAFVTGLVVLGAPVCARPLGAQLAAHLHATDIERVTFVAVATTHVAADSSAARFERVAADGWWAAGALVRVLLDELDRRDARLTDAAGIAVHLATGSEDAASHLGSGVRWRRHLARGGAPDDLRIARALDSIAVVPEVTYEQGAFVARALRPS